MTMGSKFCKFCNVEHALTAEHWYRLDGSPRCKLQIATKQKASYDPKKRAAYNKQYREKNRDELIKRDAEWRSKNKERHRENARNWYYANREYAVKRHAKYHKERQKTDIEFKLSCRIRSRIYNALRHDRKIGSAINDLGCSLEFFKNYIAEQFTDGMSWDNYGTLWELDHILPLANYLLLDRGTFRRLVHYTNYQPLTIAQNRAKLNYE